MGSIIGHRIDYNGVGAPRGASGTYPAKINPSTPRGSSYIEDTWYMAARRFFFSCWKMFHSFAGFSTREENFVSPSGRVMFYLSYKHQWNAKPFYLNIFLLPKGAIYYVPIGGGHWGYPVPRAVPWKIGKYRNTMPKMDEIPNTAIIIGHVYLQLYPSRVFVYLKHVGPM